MFKNFNKFGMVSVIISVGTWLINVFYMKSKDFGYTSRV